MMRGRVELFVVLIVVWVVTIIGIGSQRNYKATTDDISIKGTVEGAKARGTIDDISIGETIEGVEPRSY
jgi:hypothetical protein